MASDEVPINHFRLLRDVRDCLDRDATVTVDAELTMGVARAVMPSFGSRLRLNSGTTGCMGTGLPYAIGAKLARPDQQVVAVLGDYAFGAAAMEVETAARVGCQRRGRRVEQRRASPATRSRTASSPPTRPPSPPSSPSPTRRRWRWWEAGPAASRTPPTSPPPSRKRSPRTPSPSSTS